MKRTFAKISSGLLGLIAVFYASPVFAQATPKDLVPCSGAACDWCKVFELLQRVFNTAQIIVFPLVVIFIIYSAVTYIISSISGSEEGITKARATFTDGIIGLIIILLTFVIVNATIVGIVGNKISINSLVSIDCSVLNKSLPAAGEVAPSGGQTP